MESIAINKIIVTGRLYNQMEQVLDIIPCKEFKFLPEEEVTKEVLEWADAYVAFKPTQNFGFYNLKWVHALGAGVDSFLLNREWKKDLILTRTICSFGSKISEYCLSYMLSHIQQHQRLQQLQNDKIWEGIEPLSLRKQKVLILGTGVIGQEVAKNLGFLGAKVIGVSLNGEQKQYFEKVIKFKEIQKVLTDINWTINTLPLTKETAGIINSTIFNSMNNACFINVGRGHSVDEKSLINAVNNGNLQLVVLDVFQSEPLPVDSELWNNPKILITPHIAAITSVDEAAKCFLDTLSTLESNPLALKNKVDIERGY